MGEGWRKVGGAGSIFSHFLGSTRFLRGKREKKYTPVTAVIYWFTMYQQNFISIGPKTKKKSLEHGHDDKSPWHYVRRETVLQKCIRFTTSIEISNHSFWSTKLVLTMKEAKLNAQQKFRDFFFNLGIKKTQPLENENF